MSDNVATALAPATEHDAEERATDQIASQQIKQAEALALAKMREIAAAVEALDKTDEKV